MIPFKGNRNQPLWIGQGGPVCLRRRRFWICWVGDVFGPPWLVLILIVSAAAAATYVAVFRSSSCGRLGTISLQVFIASAAVTYFLLASGLGLSALLVAPFSWSCLWGALLDYIYDLPIFGRWLTCFHEGHSRLRAWRHALPGLRVHKLIHELCGFGVWLRESVRVYGLPTLDSFERILNDIPFVNSLPLFPSTLSFEL